MGLVTILIVDDERGVRDAMRAAFETQGWNVCECHDRQCMFETLNSRSIDLITLDIVLGNEDGLELAKELRKTWNIPILMISGKATPEDRVIGLEYGADDYITKPFHIKEVILRVRKTLDIYQREISTQSNIVFDHSQFDAQRGVLTHLDGSLVDLTWFEQRLLALFLQHPGRILTRDELSQALRGRDWSPEDRTLDGHVARLRRKIESKVSGPEMLIRSVRGIGYVFTGQVRTTREQTAPPAPDRNDDSQ
ncbi:response regulator transcription factor [Salipiger mangrovisoli]|uniref:Response regulator transcription factor n=1 Tax=Salipiger mangrovisoli TaxID=2865933 RepID=A0ABR9X5H2_9RHOB|nr:response regulator transcription factor [Salipiger mangrovisoli]MBE9638787.1 response regulator transcription factor [Salipiger mangrovisoli]